KRCWSKPTSCPEVFAGPSGRAWTTAATKTQGGRLSSRRAARVLGEEVPAQCCRGRTTTPRAHAAGAEETKPTQPTHGVTDRAKDTGESHGVTKQPLGSRAWPGPVRSVVPACDAIGGYKG